MDRHPDTNVLLLGGDVKLWGFLLPYRPGEG
jgi:hypothetical protein